MSQLITAARMSLMAWSGHCTDTCIGVPASGSLSVCLHLSACRSVVDAYAQSKHACVHAHTHTHTHTTNTRTGNTYRQFPTADKTQSPPAAPASRRPQLLRTVARDTPVKEPAEPRTSVSLPFKVTMSSAETWTSNPVTCGCVCVIQVRGRMPLMLQATKQTP